MRAADGAERKGKVASLVDEDGERLAFWENQMCYVFLDNCEQDCLRMQVLETGATNVSCHAVRRAERRASSHPREVSTPTQTPWDFLPFACPYLRLEDRWTVDGGGGSRSGKFFVWVNRLP